MLAPGAQQAPIVETDIPARLDRLPWGRFHTLVVAALGITWILDGLEVTLAGSVAGALKASPVLRFSNVDVGLAASAYLAGAVLGALFFGWLTDRLGRKRLFFITLSVYLVATAATALSWNIWSFALFRFLTGAGIGGEYGIPGDLVGWYLSPFAAGNFLGPVVLGRLFDTIGRRPMIAATYAVSGMLLAVAGYLFALGILSATAQTIAWMV